MRWAAKACIDNGAVSDPGIGYVLRVRTAAGSRGGHTHRRARTGSNGPVLERIGMHGKEEGFLGLAPCASASLLSSIGGIDREPENPLGEIRSRVKTESLAMP